MKVFKELDPIIPGVLDWDGYTEEGVVADLLEQQKNYGINKFMLQFPDKGFMGAECPSFEYFAENAEKFKRIKATVEPHGIELGWWFTFSIKLGTSIEYIRMVKIDGTLTPNASCPLDPAFRRNISERMALFAKIAKPSFIFMEDDYSIYAQTKEGCFCEYHLDALAKKVGRFYSREALAAELQKRTPEAIALARAWREVAKESLVLFAKDLRSALDVASPEIPIGSMQSGVSDCDGDCTYELAKALAGDRHTPFSRLYGAIYYGVRPHDIPTEMFHPIYSKQHIDEDFTYYFEADCFPHTRFYTSGKEMQVLNAAVYSAGFDGSTLQTMQSLDYATEDKAFGFGFAKERPRHEAIHQIAKNCELKGVEIVYDPFCNTLDSSRKKNPYWTQVVSFFGIPFTSKEEKIAFMDSRVAKYLPDETILKYLGKTLFLDGNAAKALCRRGYGEYLGVLLGEDIGVAPFMFDAGAREVIREGYAPDSIGRHMIIPHLYAAGHNGEMLKMTVTDPACEILTDDYTFDGKYVCPAMTRFKNKLGGTVIVMGMTLENNYSQSLLNYRRQKLFRQLITDACDEFVIVKDEPRVFTLMNEPTDENEDFIGALTLINLSSDDQDAITLHLPPKWKSFKEIKIMDRQGEWLDAPYEITSDGVKINSPAKYLDPVYLLFE